MKTILATVHGNIHGVGFKLFTQNLALSHDIKGYVQNEDNGTITIKACGEEKNINDFLDKIEVGNGSFIIDFIAVEILKAETFNGFKAIY